MMDPKQSVSSRSVIEKTCIEVRADGAVKRPAPLALLLGADRYLVLHSAHCEDLDRTRMVLPPCHPFGGVDPSLPE